MKISDMIKKRLLNKKTLLIERQKASKLAFILSALMFFSNYYLVSIPFVYKNHLIFVLPITYTIFTISILYYTYFSIKEKYYEKINTIFSIVLFLFLSIIIILLSLIFLLSEEVLKNFINF